MNLCVIQLLLLFARADAYRAGKGSFVMCVNSIRPVNTVPVKSAGSASARKAGGASSVTKASDLERHSGLLCLQE